MRKIFKFLMLGLFFGGLCSCATIMKDGTQLVPVNSNEEKVDIKVTNKEGFVVFQGQTPTTLNLKTAVDGGYFSPEQYKIVASKEGFKTETAVIDWYVSAWYPGNIIFGGLIGLLIVDPISGDMYCLDDKVYLNMTPIEQ